MKTNKIILITGAGSPLGEGIAVGLAKLGHRVIAGVQKTPQMSSLREKAIDLGLENNLKVEKLDILNPYDVNHILSMDIDILVNNAGIGEAGPASEIPLDLVRANYEINVFAPLELSQKFIFKWIKQSKKGKIIFISSLSGLFSHSDFGIYSSTKQALESIAIALKGELKTYGIKIQTINPGVYLNGYSETIIDNALRWLDDAKNFSKKSHLLGGNFDHLSDLSQSSIDPYEIIEEIIRIVPQEQGKFRNIIPPFVEDLIREYQIHEWNKNM